MPAAKAGERARRPRLILQPVGAMSGHHDHHAHGGHDHRPSPDADRGKLRLALAIIASFMLVEVVAGLAANSLALLSDAAHMLTDAGAIGLALLAARIAARPSSGTFTYGMRRAEVLSAQINGASLLVLAAVLGVETARRFADPPEVAGALVIVVGVVGAAANVGAAWALSRAERRSLNVEGAMQHVLADLLGSVAAIVSGVVIVLTGFGLADPIAAAVVVVLMLRSGWHLVRDAGRVLLEGTPKGIHAQDVGRAMTAVPGVLEVHDLHVWEVTTGFPALSAHVIVDPRDRCQDRRKVLAAMLADKFGLEHTTLQVEHPAADELLTIEQAPPG
jgi:cobalt-zinc-cadmium efflux system protein